MECVARRTGCSSESTHEDKQSPGNLIYLSQVEQANTQMAQFFLTVENPLLFWRNINKTTNSRMTKVHYINWLVMTNGNKQGFLFHVELAKILESSHITGIS